MDISDTLAPKSDQLDAVDLLGGPRTFTIERVSKGSAEQPVNVHLAGFPRPWRPGKSMRRVLAAAWTTDASVWTGRRVTLWCDPTVVFAGAEVGGVRISHLSHLDKPKKVPLLVTRGKSATYVVQPLADEPKQPAAQPVEPMTAKTRGHMFALFQELNLSEDEQRAGISHIVGRQIESRGEISETEAQQVVNRLRIKKAEKDAGAEPVEPGLFEEQA